MQIATCRGFLRSTALGMEEAGRNRAPSQRWRAFIKNHARGIVACDFLVAMTVRFRVLYVFLVIEVGSRRILHYKVTAHPTVAWTAQQFREAIPSDHGYRFLIHDRDSIFSRELDQKLKSDFELKGFAHSSAGTKGECLL